jgi:hypothetical protein
MIFVSSFSKWWVCKLLWWQNKDIFNSKFLWWQNNGILILAFMLASVFPFTFITVLKIFSNIFFCYMHNIQIMTEEISLPIRKLPKNSSYLILGHTKTKASYILLMASCKSWISLANKNKVQQMTRINWIRL